MRILAAHLQMETTLAIEAAIGVSRLRDNVASAMLMYSRKLEQE
jgi:hypothetical protein